MDQFILEKKMTATAFTISAATKSIAKFESHLHHVYESRLAAIQVFHIFSRNIESRKFCIEITSLDIEEWILCCRLDPLNRADFRSIFSSSRAVCACAVRR